MTTINTGGSAFPSAGDDLYNRNREFGMTLRDYFAGQALANPAICTGEARDYELTAWFGQYATGITKSQIVAAQASDYADAMLAQREKRIEE